MSLLPSILDLERQLARIEPPRTDGEAQAVRIARALLHHVRNFGTPQSAPMSAKLAAQSLQPRSTGIPAHLVRPRAKALLEQVSGGTCFPRGEVRRVVTRAPSAKARPAAAPQAQGLTVRQVAERSGFSSQYVANLLWAGVLPKPEHAARGNTGARWNEATGQEVLAILADPARRKRPSPAPAAVPEHWVSAEQFAKRMGYAYANMIHHLVGAGRIPPHEFNQGRKVYWSEATVTAATEAHQRPKRTATRKDPA